MGIPLIHCPYCRGYEVRNERTGILSNGDDAFDSSRLISNGTKDLTLFTKGTSTLSAEQITRPDIHNIEIVEKEIERLVHTNGHLQNITFKDGSKFLVKLYMRLHLLNNIVKFHDR
ncbi:MAG TPA: hypothetical protein VK369_13565 [Segetibacter sp.]|nr:hypothetical protein [Segetibacter sp.]